jgi:hypothetical protein
MERGQGLVAGDWKEITAKEITTENPEEKRERAQRTAKKGKK